MKQDSVYKVRSAAANIGAAIEFASKNLPEMLKKLWLPMTVLAIAYTGLLVVNLPNKALSDWGSTHPLAVLAMISCSQLLTALATAWLMAAVFRLFNGNTMKRNLLRALVVVVLCTAFALISSFAYGFASAHLTMAMQEQSTTAIAIASISILLLTVAIAVFTLPFLFSFTKYLADHTTRTKAVFSHDYAKGWRHWGQIFVTMLLAVLVLIPILIILLTPLFIINMAQAANQLGMLNGDPSGAPSYLMWLLVATSFLSFLLLASTLVWTFIVEYHLYASIDTFEKQKAKA